jgi:hypothetical protein
MLAEIFLFIMIYDKKINFTEWVSTYLRNNKKISVILLIVFLIFEAFLILNAANSFKTNPYSDEIKIKPAELYYSPLTSSQNGLQLSVQNITSDQSTHTVFRWSTNYGYFVLLTPTGYNKGILGNSFVSRSTESSWSYPTEDIEQNKSPVKIKLEVIDLNNNNDIVSNTSLNLTWFTKDIVFVNYSS